MLEIYYHPLSFPALSALFVAEALGLDYERKIVDLPKGEQRSPEYQEVNPYKRVPALKDGDFCLSESMAIMRYLARREKSSLYPSDLKVGSKVDQWMDYIAHHIRTPVARVQFNRSIAPMIGQEPDESSIQVGLKFLSQNLGVVDQTLSEHDFLCGETMSLADIALVGALEPVEMARIDISDFPVLESWLKIRRLESFYTNVHTHFGAELGM